MGNMNMANTKKRVRRPESTKKYWEQVYREKEFIYELNRDRYIFYSLVEEFGWRLYDCDQTVDVRVLTVVIKRSQEIESLVKESMAFLNGKEEPMSQAEWDMNERAIDKAYASLNRILARYTATPTVHIVFDLEWIQQGPKGPKIAELRSVLEILEIAQEGHISDLQQCAQCYKWGIAMSRQEQFCTGNECREKSKRSAINKGSDAGIAGVRVSADGN
jgi:hypothetical protein